MVNLKKKPESTKEGKPSKDFYTIEDKNDNTLIFESRFESGNLQAAYKMNENLYNLVIQNDTNTSGYSQWFFFRVKNTRKNSTIKFNILNLMKGYSLYNKGMQISIYSEKKAKEEKISWFKGGKDIDYYTNSMYKYLKESKRFLSSLIFKYEFEYDDDTVYFANTIPYLYTDLIRDLNEIQKNENKTESLYRKNLCSTLARNKLEILTISKSLNSNKDRYNNLNHNINNENDNYNKDKYNKDNNIHNNINYNFNYNDHVNDTNKNKPVIILMGRVHPGETVSSWMMKGIIEFLCSDCDEANLLKSSFVFKIIPMMNPDGVVCGNYRTSLAGCDLNRRWINPNEILHPEIFYTKQMILKLHQQRDIKMIVDFHGHSGATNIFMYGNELTENTNESRVFPMLISKMSNCYNFSQCSFNMSKKKYGTARINLYHELDIANIFTVEASFWGITKEVNLKYFIYFIG